VALALAAACGGDAPPPPAPTTTTTTLGRVALPSSEELLELERNVGTSDPLEQTIAAAAPPMDGVEGVPGTSPAAGPEDALVYVFLFTDFQCPVCRRAAEPTKLLVRRFPDDVRVVVKHAASPLHERAPDAAAASLAAFRQGAFWRFFDRAFTDPRRLAASDLRDLAHSLDLDLDRFDADMASEAVREQVRYETKLAGVLGVSSTPSFVVNGAVQRGWGSYSGIERMVDQALARARVLLADGTPRADVAREATRTSDPEVGPALAAALFGPDA